MSEEEKNLQTENVSANEVETANEVENANEVETANEVENVNEVGAAADEKVENVPVYRSEEEIMKASKKTTIVMLCIIVVLIAVIGVFAYMGYNRFFKKDAVEDDKKTEQNADVVPGDADAAVDSDAGNEETVIPGTDVSMPDEQIEIETLHKGKDAYGVTVVLGEYKGIEVEVEVKKVTDEDVQSEIDYFLEECAVEEEITDRPVQMGDVATIDFTGYMDGEAFEGGADTDYPLEIGSGSFIPGFEEALIGANVGDEVDVNVSFPDPYPNNPDFAGKPALFVVKINSVTCYAEPELTDELVAENTEYETVEDFVASVRQELEDSAIEIAESEVSNAILEKLFENSTFSGDIELEIEDMSADYITYYDQQAMGLYGVDAETLFSIFYGWDSEEFHKNIRKDAEYAIKSDYIFNEIAKVEGFEVTDEEYQKELKESILDVYGFESIEDVLEEITQEELDNMITQNIIGGKVNALIHDNAIVNYK